MLEQRVDTSRHAHVVLDIGGDVGALLINAGAEHDGMEIEVSPIGDDSRRTHGEVRRRALPGERDVHCALIPELRQGRYTVWRDASTRWGVVSVRPGAVTAIHWV